MDAALDAFVLVLAPADLRGVVGGDSRLRRELALPQDRGGLGIPIAAREAPIRAAEQWSFCDALLTQASRVDDGYVLRADESGVPSAIMRKPVGIDAYSDGELVKLLGSPHGRMRTTGPGGPTLWPPGAYGVACGPWTGRHGTRPSRLRTTSGTYSQ